MLLKKRIAFQLGSATFRRDMDTLFMILAFRYVHPISGEGSSAQVDQLDTEKAIDEEIKKQESLLADLHLQISSGAASKKTEEQIWEQQRIVTQLKVLILCRLFSMDIF